ncbi:hypothetical protein [Lunatibacter salilacus]|uniref:hypothetical protein n=1 Tax=Lunatibacter salilacus TaxID=2483804 RepID=UPI00131DB599|nr:hypothetical protein [Lunatibacter salilacus]
MHTPNNLSKILKIAAFGGMLFCCLFITEVTAQSDKEKSDSEQVKSPYNSFTETERKEMYHQPSEKKSSKMSSSTDKVTRDSSGYRVEELSEVKDEATSTLSFNIFLYVLDRFKEK